MHVLQMQTLSTFQGLINMGPNQNNYYTYIFMQDVNTEHQT